MLELPRIFSRDKCLQFVIAPVIKNDSVVTVLINKDTDPNIFSAIKYSLGHEIAFKIAGNEEIAEAIEALYSVQESPDNPSKYAENNNSTIAEDYSIIGLIDDIISEAAGLKASDIHLEPFKETMLIRYRLDGVLQQKRVIRKENILAVTSRLKIMSGLDIAEKRRPQDGRIRFKCDKRLIDIRVSILPTDFGEKVVLRLLDKSALRLDLGLLGFLPEDMTLFKEKIGLPNGIILITGPTGSGKTTTLYAALNYIKSPGINITTIEDPIEYNLEGINQTQIKPEINLTFGSALRAILRQDPNVIMVGEIRDKETLDNALRASLTGHLVLSTVHTNDSISTIARLLDLGADRNLLGTAIRLIVAQRLIRRICPHCKIDHTDSNENAAALAIGLGPDVKIYNGKGCEKCQSIGFWGRTAIYEMLPIDGQIESAIIKSFDNRESLSVLLKERGISTLRERGIELIKKGVTTPSEVLRETS
jgi:type II secretory ATPase GspE/PulE/Tfp pilus assembly ATPase PilB-like protein